MEEELIVLKYQEGVKNITVQMKYKKDLRATKMVGEHNYLINDRKEENKRRIQGIIQKQ